MDSILFHLQCLEALDSPLLDFCKLTPLEIDDTYASLFRLLTKGDCKPGLDAYERIHEQCVRDCTEGGGESTIKVLTWLGSSPRHLDENKRLQAIDAFVSRFFMCEFHPSKRNTSAVALLCIRGLLELAGPFPTEQGRFRRIIEVAAHASPSYEACMLLRRLATEDAFRKYWSVDWVTGVMSALFQFQEAIWVHALDALSKGLLESKGHLEEIEAHLNHRDTYWSKWMSLVKETPSKRIHVARCFPAVILFFRLCANPARIEDMFRLAESLLEKPSEERTTLLDGWDLVKEACAGDSALQVLVDMPLWLQPSM